jgi:hypothetical protein
MFQFDAWFDKLTMTEKVFGWYLLAMTARGGGLVKFTFLQCGFW